MRKITNVIKLVTVASALSAALVGGFQTASADGGGPPAPKAVCRAGKIVRNDGGGPPAPKSACKSGKIVRTDGGGPPAPK